MITIAAIRERFRNRPDTEHEQVLVRVSLGLAYIGMFLLYFHATGDYQWDILPIPTAYVLLSPIAIVWIYFRPGVSHLRRILFTVADRVVITNALLNGNLAIQASYPLFIWVDLGNGARYGRTYQLFSTGVSALLWAIVLVINPVWRPSHMMMLGVGLLIGIVLIPFYARVFHRRLEDANARLFRAYQEVNRLATHDTLTSLPNRAHLYQRLRGALAAGERHRRRVAVLYIDLDNFKRINDIAGHESGDRALCAAADVFRNLTRKNDTVARVGGDEFIIVLTEVATRDLLRVGQAICAALVNHPLSLSASIGVATFPDCATTAEELIAAADKAMYEAKHTGKNRCVAAPVVSTASAAI
jgi:diguanylate cyclase (GGDEF)-like protein